MRRDWIGAGHGRATFGTTLCIVLALANWCVAELAHAQPGDLRAFAGGQVLTLPVHSKMLTLPDGSMIVVSNDPRNVSPTPTPSYEHDLEARRLLPDGTLDNAFGDSGVLRIGTSTSRYIPVAVTLGPDGQVSALVTLDGAIVVRFSPEGRLDTQFGQNGVAVLGRPQALPVGVSIPYAISVGPGGRTYVTGQGRGPNDPTNRWLVQALNTDGTPATAFNETGLLDSAPTVRGTIVHADASGLYVGGFTTVDGNPRGVIARYTSVGQPDASFGSGGSVRLALAGSGSQNNTIIRSLLVPSAERVIAVGQIQPANDQNSTYFAAAVNAQGQPVDNFGTRDLTGNPGTGATVGPVGTMKPDTAALRPDGRILITGGNPAQSQMMLAELMPNGTPNPTLGSQGMVTSTAFNHPTPAGSAEYHSVSTAGLRADGFAAIEWQRHGQYGVVNRFVGLVEMPSAPRQETACNGAIARPEAAVAPTLAEPADDHRTELTTLAFSWQCSGAQRYELFVDNRLEVSGSATEATVSNLMPGQHTWFVRAHIGATSAQSIARSFTVAGSTSPGPQTPSGPDPAGPSVDPPADSTSTGKATKVRAIGDSVTAAFGYHAAGGAVPNLRSIYKCRPPRVPDNRCSSPNAVAYPAVWAKAHGVPLRAPNFANLAYSGATPKQWIERGQPFRRLLDQVVADNPRYTLMTLGANPLLSQFAFTDALDGACVAFDLTGRDWTRKCVKRELRNADTVNRLARIYQRLLDAPNNHVFVFYYHKTYPKTLPRDKVNLLFGELNGAIASAVSKARLARPRDANRLRLVTPSTAFAQHGCKSRTPWVIATDTCIHPSGAGHAQFGRDLDRTLRIGPFAQFP